MVTFPNLVNYETRLNTVHAMHFTSLQQFASCGDALHHRTAPRELLDRMKEMNSYYTGRDDFTDRVSGDEFLARSITRKCSDKVRDRVNRKSLEVNMEATGTAEFEEMNFFHDEQGMFIDTTAYFAGEEDCMINFDFNMQVKPIIYMAVPMGASCAWNNTDFENRGIAAIRCIHALERKGYSVGVIGYSAAKVNDSPQSKQQRKAQLPVYTVMIKAPENSLDESDLINALTNAVASRTIGFNIKYCLLNSPSSTLGHSQTLKREDLKGAMLGDIKIAVLPVEDRKFYSTVAGATRRLTDVIKDQVAITI